MSMVNLPQQHLVMCAYLLTVKTPVLLLGHQQRLRMSAQCLRLGIQLLL